MPSTKHYEKGKGLKYLSNWKPGHMAPMHNSKREQTNLFSFELVTVDDWLGTPLLVQKALTKYCVIPLHINDGRAPCTEPSEMFARNGGRQASHNLHARKMVVSIIVVSVKERKGEKYHVKEETIHILYHNHNMQHVSG